MIAAYWFFGDTLRDGRPIPPDGEWLTHDGPLVLCASGLHASEHPFDALSYAPGPWLARVTVDGEVVRGEDKLCARRRRIDQRMDATAMLRTFARDEARRLTPEVVRRYLETGDETIRAAAWAAARDRFAAAVEKAFEVAP